MDKFRFSELINFLQKNNYIDAVGTGGTGYTSDISNDYGHISDFDICGFSSLNSNKPGTVTWLKEGNSADWHTLKTAVIICGEKTDVPRDAKCVAVKVSNPRLAFISLLDYFTKQTVKSGVEDTVVTGENCNIGENVYIGHHVVLGDNIQIGDNTIVYSNAVIYSNTVIGSGCIIHSGAVLGADGFGFERNEQGVPVKFPHIGGVVLGDNVEVKSYTCINRGTLDNTEIHDNVKIDDLCHIGHNVIIRDNTIITSGCSLSGHVRIGKNCWIAPRSSIRNRITVEDSAVIGMGAVVINHIDENDVVAGVPAKSIKKKSNSLCDSGDGSQTVAF